MNSCALATEDGWFLKPLPDDERAERELAFYTVTAHCSSHTLYTRADSAGRTQRVQAACSVPESDRDEYQRDAALIAPFTPSFGGLLNLLPGTQHLRLRDLTAHMQRPCVADLKACEHCFERTPLRIFCSF